jgi:Asp-tRNA(Asn)/Glu-tRNA(Gln) amidotransferase B subunit
MRIHRLTKKTVQAYTIEHGHKISEMTYDLLVKNQMKDGASSSMIRRWITKIFQRQAQEANKPFNKFGLQETLETFFERFEQHCISDRADKECRLVLLQAFISRDEVRRNIEESIVYRLPYKEVKNRSFRDFSKQLEYRVFEELET